VAVLAVAYVFVGRSPAPRVASAADVPSSTTGVVVDGTGKVSGTPDVLRVTMGVSVTRGDVSSALDAANKRQRALIHALVNDGAAVRDIQTNDVSIYQSYDNHGRVDGYSVNETVTVKLRDLKHAGKTISDAVSAGGTEALLQGVSFSLEDNKALLAKARDAAFDDAKAKAEQYAARAGKTLGDVQLVTETTTTPSQPISYGADKLAMVSAAPSAVPIAAGTQDVTVTATIRWSLR